MTDEKFKHTKKISHFLHTTSYIQIAHDTSRIIFFLFLYFSLLVVRVTITISRTKQTTVASKSAIGTTIERSIVASVVGV